VHLRFCKVLDGANNSAPHFELYQSWLPLPASALAARQGAGGEVEPTPDAQPRDGNTQDFLALATLNAHEADADSADEGAVETAVNEVLARRAEAGRVRDEDDDIE